MDKSDEFLDRFDVYNQESKIRIFMSEVSFEDFYQVPDLKFDILKLRKDLKEILKKRKF